MKCKSCKNEHDGNYGSGGFCCSKCARSYSTKNDNKQETKWSKCTICEKEIEINKRASHKTAKCENCKNIVLSERRTINTEDVIFKGMYSDYGSHRLKKRLINEGYKEHKCEKCGITEWNGKKCPIILDHIDGNT